MTTSALDLQPYRLPLAPAPSRARHALDRGVAAEEYPGPDQALSLLIEQRTAYADGVRRSADGKALVLCTTDMPGVTPAMIDWWFGWHLPETARYQLWHPRAHLKAVCKEDRSHLPDDRARYVGNVSYVDEYIGSALQRLAIAFHPPASFGITGLDARGATAICARTSDRILASEGGCLVHLILPTDRGSEMRSAFWLGEIENQLPLVGPLITKLVNRPAIRTRVITDRFLLDLFEHCAEEMNHLVKYLPSLYRDVHAAGAASKTAART
ncbi:MAG: hypothetical protein RL701_761 [Pseudomonadota bacterium]